MSIARILRDHTLSSVESLVLLSISTDGEYKEYVTIVAHPDGGGLSFRATELVNEVQRDLIWMKRTMFNGRSADQLVNERHAVQLDGRKITLEKENKVTLGSAPREKRLAQEFFIK